MKSHSAVVIGAGIAGLLAARVLSERFDQVTVVERDELTNKPANRKSTPQSHHLHLLLPGGLEILKRLYPGLEATLDRFGAITAGPSDWYAYTPHGKTYRVSRLQKTPLFHRAPLRFQSRALLEHVLRQATVALPGVVLRRGKVAAPLFSGGRIEGVALESGEALPAQLTVDASGRSSRSLAWLKTLGYPLPSEDTVNCDFAYTSQLFRPTDRHDFNDVGFMISSASDGTFTRRGGSLGTLEGNRWQVTLAGRLGDYPPDDDQGFRAYAETLQHPRLIELIADAEPMDQPHRYRFPRSTRRRFQDLPRFPEGLLPIGDALCHINPGYGQGMSLACRQAESLARCLEQPTTDWRSYFLDCHEQTRAPWLFAAQIDFSKAGTTGDFPEDEQAAIQRLGDLNRAANQGVAEAADLVDSVFDMALPLSAVFEDR